MAHRETKKPSSADKYKATEAAFKMLYDRIGHHEKQMKETSHSEFSLTALSKFTYTLTQYFDKCQNLAQICLLYTSPSPRDRQKSRMPSSA